MFRRITLTCISLIIVAGTAVAQNRYTADKIVAVVGNSPILYSELETTVQGMLEDRRKNNYTSDRDPMNEALETLLLRKLLSNQAQIDSVQINLDGISAQVEEQLISMVAAEGSISALEKKMGKAYFDIRQGLRDNAEEMYYAQGMYGEVTGKVKITPGEVERFYKRMAKDSLPIIPEQYVYAQITRYPKSSKGAKQNVKEQLLEIRERILNGTNFSVLAAMYSVDQGSAYKGGDLGWSTLERYVKPFADALAKLQPGQISEIVESEHGYHIIELMEKRGDEYKARHILLKPTFTDVEISEGSLMLDSLANEIRTGKITFEDASLKYSDDKYSRNNGGIVTNHELLEMYGADINYSTTRFMKEDLQVDYPVIRTLKEGEISNSYRSYDMKNNQLSKIVKLIEIIPAHTANMVDDYTQIENIALQSKQQQEFEKWVNSKIDGMYVRIEPEFRDGAFQNKNWVK